VKHIVPFKLYELEGIEPLVRDLRNVGMNDFEWNVAFENTRRRINEESEKDYVAAWRSKSGARAVKITGRVARYAASEDQEFFAQFTIELSDGKEYTGRLSTGSDDKENYANLRVSTPTGWGPLLEKGFSAEEGRKIRDGEKLIMGEILPLINNYTTE
jgi:hypothetical protein